MVPLCRSGSADSQPSRPLPARNPAAGGGAVGSAGASHTCRAGDYRDVGTARGLSFVSAGGARRAAPRVRRGDDRAL